jgi:hypothetical protein
VTDLNSEKFQTDGFSMDLRQDGETWRAEVKDKSSASTERWSGTKAELLAEWQKLLAENNGHKPTASESATRASSVEQLRAKAQANQPKVDVVSDLHDVKRPDMPATVLCGRLGEWCRKRLPDFPIAYSWPAMVAAASVSVKTRANTQSNLFKGASRCNLYAGLVGPVHTGKTQAIDRTNFLLQINAQGRLLEGKYGSGEGMLEQIGNRNGDPVLWSPDELSHVLEKAQIQNASFPFILNTMFYKDHNELTVQNRRHINCNARLSVVGGIVEDNFGNSFGAATTSGLYDRFLFGLFPTGSFEYLYRPMEGDPVVQLHEMRIGEGEEETTILVGPRVETPVIDKSVWDARDTMVREEKIDSRILELAIRVALVCAAWDEKDVLLASDLEPHWDLARYQQRVRGVLQPNPGRNFEAMAAFKILNFLKEHNNGWMRWRDICRATHVAEYGPSTADRAARSLVFSGELEDAEIAPPKGGRKSWVLRLAQPPQTGGNTPPESKESK